MALAQWRPPGTVVEVSVTCPRCGRTSHHPADVAEGYCGACHDWTSPRANLWRMVRPQLAAQVRRVCAELS